MPTTGAGVLRLSAGDRVSAAPLPPRAGAIALLEEMLNALLTKLRRDFLAPDLLVVQWAVFGSSAACQNPCWRSKVEI